MSSLKNDDSIKRWFIFALLTWAVATFVGGYYGIFTKIPQAWFAPLVLVGIVTPVLCYYLNANFRLYIASISLKYLTLFNVWRIPAGFTFLYYGSHNLLPEQFIHNSAYGDLTVGLLALVVVMFEGGLSKYLVFHILGLLDFIVAVGTGLTFTVLQVPLMENIRTFPVVVIPLYGVCITGALHIMTLDILLRRRKAIEQLG